MDPFQYRDLPQIPTLADEQQFTFWGPEHFEQSHSSQASGGRAIHFHTGAMDYDDYSGHGALNMQPMQRFLHGVDPLPFAAGLRHVDLDRTMPLQSQTSRPYEHHWPSADCLPYSYRKGSPDMNSVSGASSHNSQNELCSPQPHSTPYGGPIELSQARLSYPSPPHFDKGPYPSELPLPGNSVNLRAIELHHEEPENTAEDHEHMDAKLDDEYEQEPTYGKMEPVTDSYNGYRESGAGNAQRDAESVQRMTQSEESDSDYKPSSPRGKKNRRSSTSSRGSGRQTQKRGGRKDSTTSTQSNSNRINKRARGSNASLNGVKSSNSSTTNDTDSQRPFPCPLAGYGCQSNFVSKNEWKRHHSTQHIKLGFWRCDLCPTTVDPHDDQTFYHNDFNRKDLFTQHLRRMHAAPTGQSARTQKEYPVNEDNISEHQQRCYQTLRTTPSRSSCLFCNRTFTGLNSWEERMEHIGRHLEKDRHTISLDTTHWNKDKGLEQWLLEEGLITNRNGEWTIGDGKPKRHSMLDGAGDTDDEF